MQYDIFILFSCSRLQFFNGIGIYFMEYSQCLTTFMPSFLFCSIFLLFSILLFSMDVLNGAYLLMMLVHLCFPLLAKWMIENLSFSRSFDTLVMFIVVVVEHTFQKEKSLSNPSKSLIFSSSFIECIVMA